MHLITTYYEAFQLMVLSSTLLGNKKDKLWCQDSDRIISIIGSAYAMSEDLIIQAQSLIKDKLFEIELVADTDYNFFNNDNLHDNVDESILYDLKSKTITYLQNYFSPKHQYWLDYRHYNTYHPSIHFYNMLQASKSGNVIACRQLGILYALGIGVNQDLKHAILKFSQSAYWGDLPSIYLLTKAYQMDQQDQNHTIHLEVVHLAEKYLNTGVTLLPDEEVASNEAKMIYIYLASIYQDVVAHRLEEQIDYSFVEVILLPHLDYRKKMHYINHYQEGAWKDATNSTSSPESKFGFIKGSRL